MSKFKTTPMYERYCAGDYYAKQPTKYGFKLVKSDRSGNPTWKQRAELFAEGFKYIPYNEGRNKAKRKHV